MGRYLLLPKDKKRGLRRGEAGRLHGTDVDLDHRMIVIGQQRSAWGTP